MNRRSFLGRAGASLGVVGTFGLPEFLPMTPEPVVVPAAPVDKMQSSVPEVWAKESLRILQKYEHEGRSDPRTW